MKSKINLSEIHPKKTWRGVPDFLKWYIIFRHLQRYPDITVLLVSCAKQDTVTYFKIVYFFSKYQTFKIRIRNSDMSGENKIHYLQALHCQGGFYRKTIEIATFLKAYLYISKCSQRLWKQKPIELFHGGLSGTGGGFPGFIFSYFFKGKNIYLIIYWASHCKKHLTEWWLFGRGTNLWREKNTFILEYASSTH